MLARGADPNNQDTNGNTVLHMLVIYEKIVSIGKIPLLIFQTINKFVDSSVNKTVKQLINIYKTYESLIVCKN